MRKITFYPHLAITNVLRNNQFYLPYLLTNIATVAMFYILAYLSFDDTLASFPSANNVQVMMGLGCIVVGIFSTILVFYTNSFVMKRRQHELGLYSILGMETRHIARLLRVEALFLGLFSLVCGLAAGIILSKLMLMLLLKLLHFPVSLGFSISIVGIAMTTVLFTVLFLLVLLHNLIQLRRAKPVELLRSSSVGEREPKVKWLLALVGIVTLVAGYVMANTIQSPLEALTRFFFAVVLVIIGTYCIFTAGSIAVLKLLRANKHYYYKPQHFTTVSGLLYRMKQNAVGLASICILSTMLLVTVSTTVCLYLGVETSLKESFPRDINYTISLDERQTAEDAVKTMEKDICRFSFFNFIASLFQVSLSLWIHHANIGVLLRYLGIVLGSLHCNSYLFANTRFTTSACYNCSQCNMDIRRTSCHLSIIGNDQGLIRQPDDRSTKCAAVGQLKVCYHSRDITQVQRLSCIHSEVLL